MSTVSLSRCPCEIQSVSETEAEVHKKRVDCLHRAFKTFCEQRHAPHLYQRVKHEFDKASIDEVDLRRYYPAFVSLPTTKNGYRSYTPAYIAECVVFRNFVRCFVARHPSFVNQVARMSDLQLDLMTAFLEKL